MAASNTADRESDTHAGTWLLPDDVEAMRSAAYDVGAPRFQARNEAAIALLYDLGLRASEVVALDRENLELDERPATVYLPRDLQKGNAPPVPLELGKWGALGTGRTLRNYLRGEWYRDQDTPALFPSREGERMTARTLQRVVKRVARAADVEPQLVDGGTGDPDDVTPHTLRHSVAYRIIREEDGRLEDVQVRLRHANRATTDQVYSHIVPR